MCRELTPLISPAAPRPISPPILSLFSPNLSSSSPLEPTTEASAPGLPRCSSLSAATPSTPRQPAAPRSRASACRLCC
uniref:Uncharacterized protein n=1 Tax=Arundo donax TaxID=35708 RepID=A0A0A9G8U2_ARUDO